MLPAGIGRRPGSCACTAAAHRCTVHGMARGMARAWHGTACTHMLELRPQRAHAVCRPRAHRTHAPRPYPLSSHTIATPMRGAAAPGRAGAGGLLAQTVALTLTLTLALALALTLALALALALALTRCSCPWLGGSWRITTASRRRRATRF